MKRILHVLGTMNRGGTESMLMTHYRKINRDMVQFDFVVHTSVKCDFEEEILSLGGRILRVPRFNGFNYFSYQKAWHQLLQQYKEYSVIHVHHFLVAGIILPVAARHELPVRIVHSHNTKPPIFILKEKVMWLFHRNMIKYSTQRLACSDAAGEYLFGTASYSVFKNAIETKRFKFSQEKRNEVRKSLGISENTLVVGHIGSFRTKQKNHDFIVSVFSEIVRLNNDSRLLLIGEGDLMPVIMERTQTLKIDNKCSFLGVRTDIPDLLSAMDVFLFPSFFEGLGIVVIEAQANGLPCVVSDALQEEAKVSDLFKKISLNVPAVQWAESILRIQMDSNREKYADIVSHSGYDVEDNIRRLMDIYKV